MRVVENRPPQPGPTMIRHLASATSVYRQMLTDAGAVIRTAIEESSVEQELVYAELMRSRVAAAGALESIEEQCQYLLGLTDGRRP